MKLIHAYFDSYRSLLDKDLAIDGCIGLVGINESGKSNVLRALNTLAHECPLERSSTPRMAKRVAPQMRFVFSLSDSERTSMEPILHSALAPTLGDIALNIERVRIVYHVQYNKLTKEDERFFVVEGLAFPNEVLGQTQNAKTDGCSVVVDGQEVPMGSALIVEEKSLVDAIRLVERAAELARIQQELHDAETDVAGLESQLEEVGGQQDDEKTSDASAESEGDGSEVLEASNETTASVSIPPELIAARDNVSKLRQHVADLESEAGIATSTATLLAVETKIASNEQEIPKLEKLISESTEKLQTLQALATPTAAQTQEMETLQSNLTKNKRRLTITSQTLEQNRLILDAMRQPVGDKYSSDDATIARHLGTYLADFLSERLPHVVFWQYSDEYVLPAETTLDTIMNAERLTDISRPLVNLFLIGLGIATLEELKEVIEEIQTDLSDRSKYERKLNTKVQEYLKRVWEDYDQEISIKLEQERISVQIYDPARRDDASFFAMQERSQGAKSFISFLLTIGAEAKKGVISNTLLLLDEPETHLHPSGVRHMLKELIAAAKNDNVVVFATHSIFMIDRTKYDRHVIVKKECELTTLQPSRRDRIGYFMQEEVLFGALDFSPNSEFQSLFQFNYVLEGDGDVELLKHFLDVNPAMSPFKPEKTGFQHGGKCSDIQKYFQGASITINSKWVLLLDADKPANDLRVFIEGKFSEHLNQNIFVYQYSNPTLGEAAEIELEDMLQPAFVGEAIKDAANKLGFQLDVDPADKAFPFAKYFQQVLADCDDADRMKAEFKEVLNSKIREAISEIETDADFKTFAPAFHQWASETLEDLKGRCARTQSRTGTGAKQDSAQETPKPVSRQTKKPKTASAEKKKSTNA